MTKNPKFAVLPALLAPALAACTPAVPPPAAGSDYLYVWAGDADAADPDFLAVIDARRGSPQYGQVLRTVTVEGRANWPHHTEYELSPTGTLFANGWNSGRTFVFDVRDADTPRVQAVLGEAGGYANPHSYARLPNGNVLATFQSLAGGYAPPGGLVEMDAEGRVVRSASGAAPGIADADTWTYSLLVLPDLDRVVTTNTRMGLVSEWLAAEAGHDAGHDHVGADSAPSHVQVWRLSDLGLLATLALPPQDGGHHEHTAEPRRLANGEVYVNTFSCGLYRLTGLAGDQPDVEPVLHSPYDGMQGYCAVPVVIGNYWIQPSATEHAVIAYDLGDPVQPREASRVGFPDKFRGPHWLAVDPRAPRLVVTSDHPGMWVAMLDFDPASGRLTFDESFRDPGAAVGGLDFDRRDWPHGPGGKAMPHGAVFAPAPGR